MQRLVIITSLVALFMYAGFATASNRTAALPVTAEIGNLQEALSATGAELRAVRITGWVKAENAAAPLTANTVQTAMGWTGQAVRKDELRDLQQYQRAGAHYVAVLWILPATGGKEWPAKAARVRTALAAVGSDPILTVQLEGVTGRTDPLQLAAAALDRLHAQGRQPWSDSAAASIAATSVRLPAGPFGVNVQVAARLDQGGGPTRVWVAWPALQQEY